MEKIGIFCSASGSIDPIYFDAAHQIGEWMGKNGKTLIYGCLLYTSPSPRDCS